jgi:hypothetical protein
VLLLRTEFYFPALVLYVIYGLAKTVVFGLLDKHPIGDSPTISDDDEPIPLSEIGVGAGSEAARQRPHRRRRRRRPPGPGEPPHGGPTNLPPHGPIGGQP